jgi:hypothetical protein
MRSKAISMLIVTALMMLFVSACSVVARHHNEFTRGTAEQTSDPLSGEWNVSFFVHGAATPATFTFKLDGQTVTGTAYSEHTGAGTIRDGKYVDGKLSCVLDFKKHESIAIKGALQDGKLVGEFTTEGFTAKWEAVRK